jgi:hypothetical protein
MSDKPDQAGCSGTGKPLAETTDGGCRGGDAEGCQGHVSAKKHPCPDCGFCQWCSDDRCRLCLNRKGCGRRKLSLAEQIRLYDSLNQDGVDKAPEG